MITGVICIYLIIVLRVWRYLFKVRVKGELAWHRLLGLEAYELKDAINLQTRS